MRSGPTVDAPEAATIADAFAVVGAGTKADGDADTQADGDADTGSDPVAARPDPGPMITFDRVSVRFGATQALRGVTGRIGRGEWVGLIGANGAGKTTLLRALAHLEGHEGRVEVDGTEVRSLTRRRRARLVAYVPQAPELPADMRVLDYTLLGRTPHHGYFGLDTEEDRAHCGDLLDQLDLAAVAGRTLSTLSGGEVQRVVLARALAQDAPVLLLDEPTSALDLGRRVDALELVDGLRRRRGLTVVSALHDLTLAGQFADRLMLLAGGTIVASGPPAAVLQEDTLSTHYGARVRVVTTDDGDAIVVPRRTAPAGVGGSTGHPPGPVTGGAGPDTEGAGPDTKGAGPDTGGAGPVEVVAVPAKEEGDRHG